MVHRISVVVLLASAAAGCPGTNPPRRDGGDAAGRGDGLHFPDRGRGTDKLSELGAAKPDLSSTVQLPGSGDMQALDGFLCPNGQLFQAFWRGNQGFTRFVPMKTDGTPNWNAATPWSGPVGLAGLPGSGDIQALSDLVMPNKQLLQVFWRGDQGFYRTVPMNSAGTPDWGSAGAWSAPVAISILPGSGSLQAQSDFMMPNGQALQAFWRGDQGWGRTVPMLADGTPDYANASSWTGPLPLSALPGSGSMQGQSDFVMPNDQLLQAFWRGNQGWARTVPMNKDKTPDWNNASAWSGPILP